MTGTVESIFAGAGSVGANSGRNLPRLRSMKVGDDWVTREGTYLLTLLKLEAFQTRNGDDFVSAEFRVDQVLQKGSEHALQEGGIVKAMWALDRNRLGELTPRGQAEMRRVRGFFSAMFVQADIQVTDANVAALMTHSCKGAMGHKWTAAEAQAAGEPKLEGTAYPSPLGTQTICRVYDEKGKGQHEGKTYASEHWTAPPKA